MPISHTEIKNFQGLYLQANSFSVPDGALEDALNCIISKTGILQKRRGFYQLTDPSPQTLNALATYQSNLLAITTTKISWINTSTGVKTDLGGDTVSITSPRVSRSQGSNNNFYFTTDNGVFRLTAYNTATYKAGIPQALDLTGQFQVGNTSGVLDGNGNNGDFQVGFRVVFGFKDVNNNLHLGAPSDVLFLTNSNVTGSAWARVTNVITVTTTSPHGLVTGSPITISSATGTTPPNAGSYPFSPAITVTGATTFTFADTAANSTGTLVYAQARNANLEFTIPSELNINQAYFYQVYRSSMSLSAATDVTFDFGLIKQTDLTSSDYSAGFIFFNDTVDEIFRGAELYTNPNSQEGPLQANDRPPLCQDVAYYKNYMLYANITLKQRLFLNLVSVASTSNTNYLEVKLDAVTRRYVARVGLGNNTATCTGSGTTTITVTTPSIHGLSSTDNVYINNITGTLTPGYYAVTVTTTTAFTITAAAGQVATKLDVQATTDTSGNYIFGVSNSATLSENIDSTARAIIKAINRDTASLIYAHYLSLEEDAPGKMYFESKSFGNSFSMRADASGFAGDFSPVLPTSFGSGTQVSSTNDAIANGFIASKIGEPEAAPNIANQFVAGAQNKAILRVFALRDCAIFLKEDGVWRLDGDSPSNFIVTPIDTTANIVAPSSAALINNQVIFLSNQGFCAVSSNAVQIISRKIETPVTAVLGSTNLSTSTAAVSYESERLYLVTTIAPNESAATVTYCYNTITDSWTTSDQLFTGGVVGPGDQMFLIDTANKLLSERKTQTRLDYMGQNYSSAVISITNSLTAILSVSGATPVAGDAVVYNSAINVIRSVTASGANWSMTFEIAHNLSVSATPTLYKAYTARIRTAPHHGGDVGRMKQFSQFQIHTRDASITACVVSFQNDTFYNLEPVTWRASSVALTGGWGKQPWGMFPWGLGSGIKLLYSTQPSPIVRCYVPLFAQRTSFIQCVVEHSIAGEPLNIQSFNYTVRGYGERDTK